MLKIRLEGYESFDGMYDVKDTIKINGRSYDRIGRDGFNDLVVNADNSVVLWDLDTSATKEQFINETIHQLMEDGELKRGKIQVEYIVNTSRSKKEIAWQLFDMSRICSIDFNNDMKLGAYAAIANKISQHDIVVGYDPLISFPEYVQIIKMLATCTSIVSEIDEISNYNTYDFVEDEKLVSELIRLHLSIINK